MTPRTGRPPEDVTRNATVRARMTSEELGKLDYCCTHTGKTRSEIIREGIDKVYQDLESK